MGTSWPSLIFLTGFMKVCPLDKSRTFKEGAFETLVVFAISPQIIQVNTAVDE